ncbi:MAG: hypothetical protein MZV65_47275 [Chromatiales bacterium]|nr:hypothetical protein [Chromatiales bacterium]
MRTFETLHAQHHWTSTPFRSSSRCRHLPVILDPSRTARATGSTWHRSRARGIAAGADGLIIEVHPHPEEAASDRRAKFEAGEIRAVGA